jgi:hypothetical protein
MQPPTYPQQFQQQPGMYNQQPQPGMYNQQPQPGMYNQQQQPNAIPPPNYPQQPQYFQQQQQQPNAMPPPNYPQQPQYFQQQQQQPPSQFQPAQARMLQLQIKQRLEMRQQQNGLRPEEQQQLDMVRRYLAAGAAQQQGMSPYMQGAPQQGMSPYMQGAPQRAM